MATRSERLYEDDFVAWTRAQAKALRRLAEARPNEPVDWPRLIEEVADLGRSERDAFRAQLVRVMEHALKLEHSTARDPRRGWRQSIRDARVVLTLKSSRTLRRDAVANLPKLYAIARRGAAESLEDHGEAPAARALPQDCPYALDRLLDPDWLPVPRDRD